MTNITYYQGEDTSLGIWLSESPLRVTWIRSPYFQNNARCEEEEWIVIGHQLSAEHMKDCYQKMDEWNLEKYDNRQHDYWYLETRAQRKWMEEVMLSERAEKDGMIPVLYH